MINCCVVVECGVISLVLAPPCTHAGAEAGIAVIDCELVLYVRCFNL